MEEVKIPEVVIKTIGETNIMLAGYENFKVTNESDYSKASELTKEVKSKYNLLEEKRKELKQPIIEAGKRIDELFKPALEILSKLESVFKQARLVYYEEQERKRRVEEQKIRELQEKEAEKLRKRAELAEKKGQLDKAEDLQSKAIEVESIVPLTQTSSPKHDGVAIKKQWEFRVIDINKVPREYLIVNEKMLSGIATATKGTLKIEGIEFYSKNIISDRVRRNDED